MGEVFVCTTLKSVEKRSLADGKVLAAAKDLPLKFESEEEEWEHSHATSVQVAPQDDGLLFCRVYNFFASKRAQNTSQRLEVFLLDKSCAEVKSKSFKLSPDPDGFYSVEHAAVEHGQVRLQLVWTHYQGGPKKFALMRGPLDTLELREHRLFGGQEVDAVGRNGEQMAGVLIIHGKEWRAFRERDICSSGGASGKKVAVVIFKDEQMPERVELESGAKAIVEETILFAPPESNSSCYRIHIENDSIYAAFSQKLFIGSLAGVFDDGNARWKSFDLPATTFMKLSFSPTMLVACTAKSLERYSLTSYALQEAIESEDGDMGQIATDIAVHNGLVLAQELKKGGFLLWKRNAPDPKHLCQTDKWKKKFQSLQIF